MVHNHQKNLFNGSGIRLAEADLQDAHIVTSKADNRSLRAVNKVLEQDKKDLETEIEKLQVEIEGLRRESSKSE
ncbi:MAG: hypothetical protein VCA55_10380 [Verrucomicrobiales bacterium]